MKRMKPRQLSRKDQMQSQQEQEFNVSTERFPIGLEDFMTFELTKFIFELIKFIKIIRMSQRLHPHNGSFYQTYRELVQYLNEYRLQSPFAHILLPLASLVLLSDLLPLLAPDSLPLQRLAYLGGSNALVELAGDPSYGIGVGVVVLIILLSPIAVGLHLLALGARNEVKTNGFFKKRYEKSFFYGLFRFFFASFPLLFLPVLGSLGVKLSHQQGWRAAVGPIILVFICLDSLIIQYHTFQLGEIIKAGTSLATTNYPNRFIDNLLIFTGCLLANLIQSVLPALIAVFSIILLRLIASVYFPYYKGGNLVTHRAYLIASEIACFGFIVSYFSGKHELFLIIVGLLVAIGVMKKQDGNWERLQNQQQGQIAAIKNRLFGAGAFVRSFRELILLSRGNHSHRVLLEIQILKSVCTGMQAIGRGGIKKCSTSDVIHFQHHLLSFIQNFLKAAETAVSLLRFMQLREARKYILAQNISKLIDLLDENKQTLLSMLELNEFSLQAKLLLLQTYGSFYQDSSFLKEIQKQNQQKIGIIPQKELKQRLFSQKSAVIFLNVMQEVGKIIKISKNLPGVLGFNPSNLFGLSINQIMPFSIRPEHQRNILNYIGGVKQQSGVLQFYAYNSDFHLQEVIISYSWIMTDFDTFYMAGLLEKVETENGVILTDQNGFLQGWTKKLGEEFNFDELSVHQRRKFNIFPLFPTLIKYMGSLGVTARTIVFKNQKARDPNLAASRELPLPELQKTLLSGWKKMLKEQQFVGACLAEIELVRLNLCRGRVQMYKITIREFDRIENFSEIVALVDSLSNNSINNKTDRSIADQTYEVGQGSEKQQLSIFSEEQKSQKRIDSNFTLDPQGAHLLRYQQLVFGQFNVSRTSFELSAVYQPTGARKAQRIEERSQLPIETVFDPVLQRNSSPFFYLLVITAGFMVLFILNILSATSTSSDMQGECMDVIRRNKAVAIYLKSIFNPNSTYVDQFDNANLIENQAYLFSQKITYITFLGDSMPLNKYYFFNTQIPATLQRLIHNPYNTGNQTVDIIPPTSRVYYTQVKNNYQVVIEEYHLKFKETLSIWSDTVQSQISGLYMRIGLMGVCSALYIGLLILVYIRQRIHKQNLEAFFKFQKQDLQRKISQIGVIIKDIQSHVAEWNLLKDFTDIIKRQEITNIEFGMVSNNVEVKIKFPSDQETELKLEKKQLYIILLLGAVFILAQIGFLMAHSLHTSAALEDSKNSVFQLDNAAKLIVLPNYLLAGLYLNLSESIKLQYQQTVENILSKPIDVLPNLYSQLSTVPCSNCTFLYPVLTTNFKSFYSTFQQKVKQLSVQGKNNDDIKQLFYASDYVTSRLLSFLIVDDYIYQEYSAIALASSLIVLSLALHLSSSKTSAEIQKLQLFLRFFSAEVITRNKHMNRLFVNTS